MDRMPRPRCPRCGSPDVAPILRGPAPAGPYRECNDCEFAWGARPPT